MIEIALWVLLGAIVGWAMPQPSWAAPLVQRVRDLWPQR